MVSQTSGDRSVSPITSCARRVSSTSPMTESRADASKPAATGKKGEAKTSDKTPDAKPTRARAEGKEKDQDKNKKQDKKGK